MAADEASKEEMKQNKLKSLEYQIKNARMRERQAGTPDAKNSARKSIQRLETQRNKLRSESSIIRLSEVIPKSMDAGIQSAASVLAGDIIYKVRHGYSFEDAVRTSFEQSTLGPATKEKTLKFVKKMLGIDESSIIRLSEMIPKTSQDGIDRAIEVFADDVIWLMKNRQLSSEDAIERAKAGTTLGSASIKKAMELVQHRLKDSSFYNDLMRFENEVKRLLYIGASPKTAYTRASNLMPNLPKNLKNKAFAAAKKKLGINEATNDQSEAAWDSAMRKIQTGFYKYDLDYNTPIPITTFKKIGFTPTEIQAILKKGDDFVSYNPKDKTIAILADRGF